jgi:hypothetical protein
MPDSFGKRNRDAVKARKAAAQDERRVARNQRRNMRDVPERAREDDTPPATGEGDVGFAGERGDG